MSEEAPIDEVVDAADPEHRHPAWLPFIIDFGPLLAFFIAFRWARGDGSGLATFAAVKATGVFMVAIIIALIVSRWKLGRISPMLWLSAILIMGFGALTIYFHDEHFIQLKPTIIYAGLGLLLLGGWWRGRALLKILLQSAYDGLDDTGWLKLSRNWGLFFIAMALLNEGLRHWLSFDAWLSAKVWGVSILSLLFAASQLPVMMKHGLATED